MRYMKELLSPELKSLFPCTEEGIELYEEVVLMTTKGEAIAVGIAQVSRYTFAIESSS